MGRPLLDAAMRADLPRALAYAAIETLLLENWKLTDQLGNCESCIIAVVLLLSQTPS